jgi:hypothetical protein
MLKTGQEFNVNFAALKLSDSVKAQLPAWYHIGVDRQLTSLNNHKNSKCLREVHHVRTVGDLLQVIKRGRDPSTLTHSDRSNCACEYCRHDRLTLGCQAPNKCFIMANKLLDQLNAKWHPSHQPPADNLTHTPGRKQLCITAYKNNDAIPFDPSITSDDTLAHNFRVFTDPNAQYIDPAYRKHPLIETHEEEVTVCVAGYCIKSGHEDAQTGSGVWFGHNNLANRALCIAGPNQSIEVGLFAAVLSTLSNTPPFAPLHFKSTSKHLVDSLTQKLSKWEKRGWIDIPNKEFLKPIASHLRERGAITTFTYMKHHYDDPGIKGARKLAIDGTVKQTQDALDLEPRQNFNLTGAQLSTISQAVAYNGIRMLAKEKLRLATIINLDITRHAVKALSGTSPTNATIWHSIRNKDITRIIRVFLWKILHKTHKCGDYWFNIPTFEHRAMCHFCGTTDSMEHILTECEAPGQNEVWALAKTLWLKKHNSWPQILNVGSIVGCGLANFKASSGKYKPGTNRLYRILLSESAYLIWKIRCERVLERPDCEHWHSSIEIQNRWLHTMNRRLEHDCAMTGQQYGKKALKKEIVLQTWSGTLRDEQSLPENWIKKPGVLVGIEPLEQPWWCYKPP